MPKCYVCNKEFKSHHLFNLDIDTPHQPACVNCLGYIKLKHHLINPELEHRFRHKVVKNEIPT